MKALVLGAIGLTFAASAIAKKTDLKKFTSTATILGSTTPGASMNGAAKTTMNVETLGLGHLMMRGHFLTVRIGNVDYVVTTNRDFTVGQSCPAYVDKKVHLSCAGKETDMKIVSATEVPTSGAK